MAIGWITILLGLVGLFTTSILMGNLIQLKLIERLENKSSDISNKEVDREAWDIYVKPEVISWSPRITIYRNFLSVEECDHLIMIGKPQLNFSFVYDSKTLLPTRSKGRTSQGMFLSLRERNHSIIQTIETRISVFTQVPKQNGEPLQVLRYVKGEFYGPHHDYFSNQLERRIAGNRIATMIMYLNDVIEGGETYFPMAGKGECTCGRKNVKGMSVKPKRGDAVLFWNKGLNGKVDPKSLHEGCEVMDGVKWSATKWIRETKFSILGPI
ncbi:Prolyl 4-hydroxylase subunit alpha-1 [Zostera marina]|uniref:Prolyl 4-hydroxylase subunit alpha-1 n=1 Tax=Zostera marina TaxID=29655 RepID=A0A0K9NVM3_ZOSMR|nr:Prolyl 4-hydroxylase subunit alpha-1 [Zostera marina]